MEFCQKSFTNIKVQFLCIGFVTVLSFNTQAQNLSYRGTSFHIQSITNNSDNDQILSFENPDFKNIEETKTNSYRVSINNYFSIRKKIVYFNFSFSDVNLTQLSKEENGELIVESEFVRDHTDYIIGIGFASNSKLNRILFTSQYGIGFGRRFNNELSLGSSLLSVEGDLLSKQVREVRYSSYSYGQINFLMGISLKLYDSLFLGVGFESSLNLRLSEQNSLITNREFEAQSNSWNISNFQILNSTKSVSFRVIPFLQINYIIPSESL